MLFRFIAAFSVIAYVSSASAAPTLIRDAEGVREYRLANGLQVLLIPDASKPTVTVNVTYRVGSKQEGTGETGMAHLLEHLMFKTTRMYANVGAELSRRGMRFNGTTDNDRTNYFQTFPADARQLDWVLTVEADRMTGAKVLKSDLDSEMTVVRNEMESGENDLQRILMQKTEAAAYQWHPYSRSPIGARSDVEHVDIDQLRAFYRRYYQPDNATLIVAGAFEPRAVLMSVERAFGRLPKPARVLRPGHTVEPVQDGERLITVRRTGGLQALYAVWHTPPVAAREQAAFEMLASVLSDVPNGRLHRRLVEQGLATGVYGWASRNADPGLFSLGAQLPRDAALAPAQAALLNTAEGLASEPVTAVELERARRQWLNGFEETLANPQALCIALSEPIAAGDWRLLFQLRNRIEQVTVDEVNAVAGAWLKPSNRTLGQFIATDAPDRSPAAAPVDASQALRDYTPRAAMTATAAFDPTAAVLDARTERYTLPNGLKVALLPKPTRGQKVEVALALHWGSLDSLRGQRVAAAAVGDLMGTGTQAGPDTPARTRAQLADAFDALQTTWQVTETGADGAGASLSTRRQQLVPALTLLADVLRRPAFEPDEFAQAVRQRQSALRQAADDPRSVAGRALARALSPYPSDDPRYVATIDESLARWSALQLDAVQAFYRSQWGARHAELAIVGDFDPTEVKPALAKLLGDWSSGQSYARLPDPVSATAGLRLVTPLQDKANAMISGSLPLALADTDADYPALLLAAQVLGSGGFDARLMTRLRQRDGLSYGAGAYLQASSFESSGSLGFYAIFAPQNMQRVEQAFAEEIARFVSNGITPAELANARQSVLTGNRTRRANDGALAAGWVSRLERGRTFARDAQIEARLTRLTVGEVNAAIRKWIDPTRVNWSLAGSLPMPAAASR